MAKRLKPDSLLTTNDVADLLRVNVSSIINWSKKGLIPFYSTPGKHRRFAARDVAAFAARFRMPIPADLQATLEVRP